MCIASLGIVDQTHFRESLLKARNTENAPLMRLMRTISAEVWLRHLRDDGILIEKPEQMSETVADLRHSSA